MKKPFYFCLLILSILLSVSGLAAIPDIMELSPAAGICVEEAVQLPLYAGPTVQYMQIDGVQLDPSKPYVCFGQSDSWTMAAQGTPDSFGPVGWIETAAVQGIMEPELSFADRLPAMLEEEAALSFVPDGSPADACLTLARGTSLQILGRIGDALYIETETDGTVVRGFVTESAVE